MLLSAIGIARISQPDDLAESQRKRRSWYTRFTHAEFGWQAPSLLRWSLPLSPPNSPLKLSK